MTTKPKYGLKNQIETARRNLAAWPKWMQHSDLTVKGALLVADATVDDRADIHRHALKILAAEVRRLASKRHTTASKPSDD